MATAIDLPLRRDKTMIWDGVARKRLSGVLSLLDLTGATIRLVCRKQKGDDTVLFTLVSGAPVADGRIDIDADQTANRGKYVVRVEAAATSSASEFPDDAMGYYPFEIEVTSASGEVTPLAYGVFKYTPDVR